MDLVDSTDWTPDQKEGSEVNHGDHICWWQPKHLSTQSSGWLELGTGVWGSAKACLKAHTCETPVDDSEACSWN